jgi:hypothetical protein
VPKPARERCPEPLRSDTLMAWNLCVMKGYIGSNLNFRFMPRNGKWGVEMWQGDRHHPDGAVLWSDCGEIIAAAHEPLAVIRGTHD